MKELIPIEADNLPMEVEQSAVPIPAEGKRLYITQDTKTIDFHALLGQIVQCVNMGEILAEIKAGTQYVVQIPAEFQAAYESGEMFIMENMKTGKKVAKPNEDCRRWKVSGCDTSTYCGAGNCSR